MSGHCKDCGYTVCVCDEIARERVARSRAWRDAAVMVLMVLFNIVCLGLLVWLLWAAVGGAR